LTIDEYSTPIHYRTDEGDWIAIDNTLRPVSTRPGWVATNGNEWTVAFGPLSQGLELSTAAGVVSMVPASKHSPSEARAVAPEVSSPTPPAGPRLAKDVLADSAVPAPATVTYRALEPGVDLRYQVQGIGVKEDIVVAHSSASSEFSFDVVGADLFLRDNGSVRLSGKVGELFSIPPPTVAAADGTDLTVPSGVHYSLHDVNGARPGTQLTVSINRSWLATQEPEVFPLVIDPSFHSVTPTSVVSYSDAGGSSSGPKIKIGRDSAGRIWRGAVRFSQYECCLTGNHLVYAAMLSYERAGQGGATTTIDTYEPATQPGSWSGIGGDLIDSIPDDDFDFGGMVTVRYVEPLDQVQSWVLNGESNRWFGVRGTETGVTLREYDLRFHLRLYEPPQPSVVTLDEDQVLSTATPELYAEPVPTADDGTHAKYTFEITTDPEPGSGVVASWTYGYGATPPPGEPPTWQVPRGALQEGVTYWAWVYTDFGHYFFLGPPYPEATFPVEGRRFTVQLGLGEGGPSPTDQVGSVPGSAASPAEGAPSPSLPGSKLNVNMVNGNLSLSMGSKSLGTLSGGLSLGFTYNSLALDSLGLEGEFFNDTNGNGQIDDGVDQLVAKRIDPDVTFWSTSQLVAALDPTKALARWTGEMTLPAGTWELGAQSSDGLKITSGSTVLLDRWASHEPESSPVFGSSFTATAHMPIKIEWRNTGGAAVASLAARQAGAVYWDLAEWLSPPPATLPHGWTLNADATSARWVGLEDNGTSVAMFSADGSAHEFKATGDGAFTPPATAPTDLLSLGDSGRFVLQTASSQVYTFRPDGNLESLVNAADDLNPAALEYGYSGSPLRLRTIHDRVSNRTVTLSYGGDTQCGTVPAAATGLLCRIGYWDNTISSLTYDSFGRLTRFTHPGDIIYDLAYNSSGLLKSVRDPLAADTVAAGLRTNDATVLTEIVYSSDKVSTVTQPAPAAGSPRPKRTYSYSSGQAEVDVAGFTPSIGFAERVRYDSRNRITERTDAAGLTSTYSWDTKDRQIATTDPTGMRATTHYDSQGRPIAQYGPALWSSFDANGFPLSGATVPLATTEYDGGILGLAATYWANPNLAGPPSLHDTGLGTAGDMNRDWNTTLPVPPGVGGWSARFSGDLNVDTPDTYTWQIQARGSRARVWVDETLMADLAQSEPTTGWVSTTGTGQALTAGTHSIRVDMVDTSGPAGLQILWKRTGAPTFVTLPGNVVTPNYGLATSATDADGRVTNTEYSDPIAGIGPEYRLPTATVSDPTGTNLRTVSTYETPGPGSFLRRIARTLPAGNTTISTGYGGTETPLGGSGTSPISVRATSVGQNIPPATTVVLPGPGGVTSGDVMIAAVAVRGVPTVTAPTGWTLIRSDSNGSSMKLLSYWRVASGSEPADYTWSFSSARAAAGTITAYTGVNTANPVDVHSGLANTTDSDLIVAPSVTTTGPDERLIALFSIMKVTSITPPTGMQELAETSSSAGSEPPVTIETADSSQPIAGASGDKTATAGTDDRNNAQLLALRPSATGPCSVPSSTPQAGKPKRITSPDPDGTGPEASGVKEFVYDSIGRQVGRRLGTTATINTAAWACTAYDARGRVSSESWVGTATAPARTVTYLYAVGGNPLINSVSDTVWGSAGVTATADLLGRVVSYSDIYGDTTTTSYDQVGRVTNVNGPGGDRVQSYTPEGRPGTLQVDGVTMATPTYNTTTGRTSSVAYANGTTTTFGYDTFGRANSTSTANGSATTITGDQVTYSVGGRVKDQQVYTGSSYVDGHPTGDNYIYDGAGRLSDARLPGTTSAYGYETGSSCTAPDAGKNTNRSTLTITGTGAGTTSYCYDQADRLVSSTDYAAGTVVYDDHGNTTQLGDKTLDFDASDRHIRTETPTSVTRYWRDPLNRIANRVDMSRTTYVGSSTAMATGTGVTVNRPAGTQAGDLIVAGLTIANPGTLDNTGWTLAATQTQGTQRTWILWRYATGTDPSSWTLSTNGGSTNLTAALATYRGPTALAPVAVSAASTTTAGTSHALPQVSTTSDANQLVHVVGLAGNSTTTVPSGVTARATQAGNVSLLLADRYHSKPGISPAASATTGTAMNSTGLTIAIVPAATDQRLGYAGHSDSPSHLDDSTGTLIERYYGLPGGVTITEKAATEAATSFSDDFAGTNGAGWNSSKWTTTSNDSTKKVDIQSDQGELYVNGASARATATMSNILDSEVTMAYRFSDRNASSFLRLSMRASGATPPAQLPDAYRLEIASSSSTITLQKFDGGSVTPIDTATYTADTDTHQIRFRVQGTTIQARVWPDGTNEPSTWSLEATDGAITDPGILQIAHSHTSGARSVYLDDIVVSNGVSPERTWSYANLHGDVTATADNSGTRTWIGWYGPYGENPAGTSPTNTASSGTSLGWHGTHQRLTDRDLIHMGARPYAPSLGRFLAVDPIEGGCANDYVYVYGDPINSTDLTGKASNSATGNCGTSFVDVNEGRKSRVGPQPVREINDYSITIGFNQTASALLGSWNVTIETATGTIFKNGHFGAVGKDWVYTLPLIKARGPISVFVTITTVNASLRYVTCHSLPLAVTAL
jgi:RHS repeat-associated protein